MPLIENKYLCALMEESSHSMERQWRSGKVKKLEILKKYDYEACHV